MYQFLTFYLVGHTNLLFREICHLNLTNTLIDVIHVIRGGHICQSMGIISKNINGCVIRTWIWHIYLVGIRLKLLYIIRVSKVPKWVSFYLFYTVRVLCRLFVIIFSFSFYFFSRMIYPCVGTCMNLWMPLKRTTFNATVEKLVHFIIIFLFWALNWNR